MLSIKKIINIFNIKTALTAWNKTGFQWTHLYSGWHDEKGEEGERPQLIKMSWIKTFKIQKQHVVQQHKLQNAICCQSILKVIIKTKTLF